MKLFWTVVVIALLAFFAWKKVPDFVASSLSDKMQVQVKIGDIGLSTDKVAVQNVEIANPTGSTLPKAFSVDALNVNAPLTNYIKDEIVIDQIALNNIYLSIELASANGVAGNWGKIIDNLKKSSGSSESKPDAKESGKKVLIKKLILTNINVDVVNGLTGGKVQKLDPIEQLEFDNISSESGVPLEQIVVLVLEQTLNAVMKQQGLGSVIESITPKDVLDIIPNPFK